MRRVTLAFFTVILCASGTYLIAQAQSASELQNQINDRSQKISDLQKEIAKLQVELNSTSKQKQTLQSAIQTLNLSRQKLTAQITLTQTQISKTDLEIRTLSKTIATTSDQIGQDTGDISSTIRNLNQTDKTPPVLTLIAGASLSTIFDEVTALSSVREALREVVAQLSDLKTNLEANKSVAQQKRNELSSLQRDLKSQQQALTATIASQNQLLSQTKNQESSYQKLLAQKKAQEEQFEQELQQFQSKLKNTVDTSTLPHPGSGVLSWPLDSVVITQYFGNTPFATQNPQIYSGHGHNAIDLRASPGTSIKSAQDGTVLGTGNTDLTCPGASYGKWVLIKHTNGLTTLYAHLSVIAVNSSQQVARGEVIGYSGSTGYATGPHLHFGVFASDAVQIASFPSKSCPGSTYTMPVSPLEGYLNPLTYL